MQWTSVETTSTTAWPTRLAEVMASQPSAQSTLVSGLEGCLAKFNTKVAALAGDCRAAVLAVVENVICDLDQKDGRLPELADKVMPAMMSFVEKQWQKREKEELEMEALNSQEEDSMETSPQMNHRAKKAQAYDSADSRQSAIDDMSDIKVVEIRYVSKISYGLRPPLTASLWSCMAIETHSTILQVQACLTIEDIVLNNMPASYGIESIANARDSRFMMNVCDFDVEENALYAADIDTSHTDRIGEYITINIVTRDDIVVVFEFEDKATVLDKGIEAGQIDVKCKTRHASGCRMSDRYCQQLNGDIYVVDEDAKLWRVSWYDIKTRRYDVKCLFSDNVEDFYMHEHGNAILKTTGIIALSGGQSINMEDVDGSVEWSAVIRSANRWIACGDKKYDDMSTIASIDDQGVVKSSMSICTTAVDDKAFIKYLKTAIVTGDQAIILAIDIRACCHLISMTASGQLHMIESMLTVRKPDVEYPSDGYKAITSITETDVKSQYIVAGYMWIRKLTVRLN